MISIRCDYQGCPHLADSIIEAEDLPETMIPKVTVNPQNLPPYVKLCGNHGIHGDRLGFIIHDKRDRRPEHRTGYIAPRRSEPFYFKCQRCEYIWKSRALVPTWRMEINKNKRFRPNEKYGRLPRLCPKCRSSTWMTREPLRAPTKGSWRKGQRVIK